MADKEAIEDKLCELSEARNERGDVIDVIFRAIRHLWNFHYGQEAVPLDPVDTAPPPVVKINLVQQDKPVDDAKRPPSPASEVSGRSATLTPAPPAVPAPAPSPSEVTKSAGALGVPGGSKQAEEMERSGRKRAGSWSIKYKRPPTGAAVPTSVVRLPTKADRKAIRRELKKKRLKDVHLVDKEDDEPEDCPCPCPCPPGKEGNQGKEGKEGKQEDLPRARPRRPSLRSRSNSVSKKVMFDEREEVKKALKKVASNGNLVADESGSFIVNLYV